MKINPMFVSVLLALSFSVGCDRSASTSIDRQARKNLNANNHPSPSANAKGNNVTDKVELSESEWKKRLSPEQYYVLREKGTERPYINKFDEHFEAGVYSCAACDFELFSSKTKFNSGCGWPAFYAAQAGDRVKLHSDDTLGMRRVEVTCARCDSHLGHVFKDAPQTPTGNRFCINSVSLKFTHASEVKANESIKKTDSENE